MADGTKQKKAFDTKKTVTVLQNLYENIVLARYAVDNLLPYVDSLRFKETLLEQVQNYNKFTNKVNSLAQKLDYQFDEIGWAEENFAKFGLRFKLIGDKSDTNIAKIMLQDTLMDVIDLSYLLNHENNVDDAVVSLAKDVIVFQNEKMQHMYVLL